MPAHRLPAFQFYPADWLKDPTLRSVSLAARGLWMDLLCLMSESERRGYLQDANGGPLDEKRIARMTGCSPQTAKKLLRELEVCGVFSRTETEGIIYSRRMVRDEQIRQQNRANGCMGGNPALKRSDNPPDNRPPNRNPTPSSSSSCSSSSSTIATPTHKPPADEWRVAVGRLKNFGLIRAEAAVEEAAANDFTPEQILDWLNWLNEPTRKGDCGPGTILDRIRTPGAAGWSVDYGWPPPNKAAEAARRENAIDQQATAQRQKNAETEEKLRRQRDEQAVLEAAHGPTLDSMSNDELAELVGPKAALTSVLQRYGRASPLVRHDLLKMLAARDAPPLAVRRPA